MNILIITQKVNSNDPVLGFFVGWIKTFAKKYTKVTVICLEKGEYKLPENVKVYSLGKEHGISRLKYIKNFFKYIFKFKREYDAVFVHMNQEYVLLGGIFWRIFGKKITMWRNHHAGNLWTRIAVLFCHKIFCTSKYSYTATFKKTVLMPVGIDTTTFRSLSEVIKKPRSILFLARISPVKKPDVLLKALKILKGQGVEFSASFYGDALPKDFVYFENLKDTAKRYDLDDRISFFPGVPNVKTVALYNEHAIFVNLSSSGMYDKTIFEAMACGCLPIACNKNLIGVVDPRILFSEDNAQDLAEHLRIVLSLSDEERAKISTQLHHLVTNEHSIEILSDKLYYELI